MEKCVSSPLFIYSTSIQRKPPPVLAVPVKRSTPSPRRDNSLNDRLLLLLLGVLFYFTKVHAKASVVFLFRPNLKYHMVFVNNSF